MCVIRYCSLVLLALVALALPWASSAQVAVGVSITVAPPVLPVYVQPVCPAAGFIWTPGYWAYGPDGYYWVPGTWVRPPAFGLLWTPGYWGWAGGLYLWRAGYWGPHVGFYGGVNYGFGYVGTGYVGGVWAGNVFRYNTAVTNVNVTVIHNTYNQTVVNNTTVNRVSYNGGTGGTIAQPTPQEQMAVSERHTPATGEQRQHEQLASTNRAQLASVNHGRPSVAGTSKPGEFSRGFVSARNNAAGGNGGGVTGGSNGAPAKNSAGRPNNTANSQHVAQPNKQGAPPKHPGGKAPPKGKEGKPGEKPAREPGL